MSLTGATLVFDLDGTLADTAPDLAAALNHAFANAGLSQVSLAALRPWIGFGARRMITEGAALTGVRLTERDTGSLLEAFLDFYARNIAEKTRPFPGLIPALDLCAGEGARLAVCTNKRETLALALLEALGLRHRFAFVAGRDTFAVSKPHPEHLLGAIRMAGGAATRAVMVGDSQVDVATARAAGVPVIAVSFGYAECPRHDLTADAIIDHYDELFPVFARLPGILSPASGVYGPETKGLQANAPPGTSPPLPHVGREEAQGESLQ